MNTECMYILKGKTFEEAKEFCKYLDDLANRKCEEVIPCYVAQALKDIKVTSDYDGWNTPFTVKKGTYFVWAYGKDYCMYRLRPKGARRAFPYAMNPEITSENYKELAIDLWEYKGE